MISQSKNFIFSVTVRPRLPVLSQGRQTFDERPELRHHGVESERSLENVFSAPNDLRMRSLTGRSSLPREVQSYTHTGLVEMVLQECEGLIADIRRARRNLAPVAVPMPWNLPTGSVSTKDTLISGETSYWPFGSWWPEVIFARDLLQLMPAGAFRPISALILRG